MRRVGAGSLNGRRAVVTGANSGLGLETARVLAAAGAHVVLASRDQAKADTAAAGIVARHPRASVELVELDLASLDSVARAGRAVLRGHDRIDLLVNNAGLMAVPEGRTVDGFETHLGVNHLGHWALTCHLLPALLRAGAARVVTVTSLARHLARSLDPANPHLDGSYDPWTAYAQSKKANYHFAIGLDVRLRAAGAGALSLAAHPGVSFTGLQGAAVARGGGGVGAVAFLRLAQRFGMDAEHGARPQIRAATDPRAAGGQLFGPRFVTHGPAARLPVARSPGLERAIDTLWEVSEHETGLALEVGGEPR